MICDTELFSIEWSVSLPVPDSLRRIAFLIEAAGGDYMRIPPRNIFRDRIIIYRDLHYGKILFNIAKVSPEFMAAHPADIREPFNLVIVPEPEMEDYGH